MKDLSDRDGLDAVGGAFGEGSVVRSAGYNVGYRVADMASRPHIRFIAGNRKLGQFFYSRMPWSRWRINAPEDAGAK